MNQASYLRVFAGSFLSTVLLVASLNLIVDPYNFYGSPEYVGFNEVKPEAPSRTRTSKILQVARVKPVTIIGGNSRPEMGLDPASDCWGSEMRPIYNHALPGTSVYTQTRVLQDVILSGDVKNVYLGVDFTDFLVKKSDFVDFDNWPEKPGTFESRLRYSAAGEVNPHSRLARFRDMAKGVFSFSAAFDSVFTIIAQRNPASPDNRVDGFNPANDYLAIIKHEGQSVLFEQKNREILKLLSPAHLGIFHGGVEWSINFEALERFLKFNEQRNIKITMFINPLHVDYLFAIHESGKWTLFERWRKALVELVGEHENTELWDFTGFDPYSSEALPRQKKSGKVLSWFWEPAHYKKELGEVMLSRMLGNSCDPQKKEWGVNIRSSNIYKHNGMLGRQLTEAMTKKRSGS